VTLRLLGVEAATIRFFFLRVFFLPREPLQPFFPLYIPPSSPDVFSLPCCRTNRHFIVLLFNGESANCPSRLCRWNYNRSIFLSQVSSLFRFFAPSFYLSEQAIWRKLGLVFAAFLSLFLLSLAPPLLTPPLFSFLRTRLRLFLNVDWL